MSECSREGCPRAIGNPDYDYCSILCQNMNRELELLAEIYETAGDPTLDTSAWTQLVAAGDALSEYRRFRRKLVQEIKNRRLPLSQR